MQSNKQDGISENKLAEEIVPLIKEFFVCKAVAENDTVKIAFLNGQTFAITVKEILT